MLRFQSLWVQRACLEKQTGIYGGGVILLCLQPLVTAHHTKRNRISPGWSHSPAGNTPGAQA